ncbi:ThiJ/PfpI family protein [Anaerovibrio sp. JC8]|uniref:type 1 glutamine amidotransferase domain-containing protein n=1 Tax=Anaerovibrio sp. JC8 TaxID=1240085 RepID=UPI000A0CF2EA|nr:type 1 glutamine amidotransferase domain-containing protein [Anaerovibrio sp. JC8]ORT99989.1 ThiJ/PfpI family protein [Anaerovibrio sp. JC8]
MKKVLQLVSNDFEDLELWCPVMRLREEGVQVDLVAEKPGLYHGKYGVPCEVDMSFNDVSAKDYDGILVPGGWAPDKLRRFPKVLELVSEMDKDGKLIGQICHAGWVLASANVLKGREVTSTPGIKDDLANAGATWLDEPCVVDRNIVSARRPPDIPQYMKALVEVLEKQK